MERFLKAKHWQIFIIIIGLPTILEIIVMPFMIDNNPMAIMKIMPIITIFFIFGFYGWFWAIATGLQKKVPVEIKMKVKRFKIFFFIPLIYTILIVGFMGLNISGIIEHGQNLDSAQIGGFVGTIVPLHLFAMFCIFYCLYFVSKTFKTVELQREVSFSDFAGEFFLFWFFPIGIWIVQPKINKMIEEKE